MNGMEMMFKSMGIDIDGIKQVINPETVKQTLNGLQTVVRQQNEIKLSLVRIETHLNTLPKDDAMKLLAENSHLDANPVRVEMDESNE